MNDRIRELAEQSFNNANDGSITNIKIPKEFIEKFAELIVRECAEIADDNYIHRGSRDCGLAIRNHFGVDE
jgi:hypothetical protein